MKKWHVLRRIVAGGCAAPLLYLSAALPANAAEDLTAASGSNGAEGAESSGFDPQGWVKGCRLADGGVGANVCVRFSEYENYVGTLESIYDPGVSPWPPNICDRSHQVRYTPKGATSPTTLTKNLAGCIVGIGFASVAKWSPERTMKSGSQVCARAKNSRTQHVWTVWSCKTVTGSL